jgi:hypothetical protein
MKPDIGVLGLSVCQWLQQEVEWHSVDLAEATYEAEFYCDMFGEDNPFPYLSDERLVELNQFILEEIRQYASAMADRLAQVDMDWKFDRWVQLPFLPQALRVPL